MPATSSITYQAQHFGNEELVGADLDHGLLVVERGYARAAQHLHIALRLQEVQQRGEVAGLEGQAVEAAAQRAGGHVQARGDGGAVGQPLVADGANPGVLGVQSYNHVQSAGGIVTTAQTVSEVGVYTFTATPVANSYFGCIATMTAGWDKFECHLVCVPD